jgi:hypothetical protein
MQLRTINRKYNRVLLTWKQIVKTHEQPGLIWHARGGPTMEFDVKAAPSKAYIETLRRWLTELEHLEATGAATPDSCEMLVELHELLDKLYTMMVERGRQNLQ